MIQEILDLQQNREKTQRGRGETLVGGARAAVHHWFGGLDPLWAATVDAVGAVGSSGVEVDGGVDDVVARRSQPTL